MELTPQQLRQFTEEGWLFLPELLLAEEEVAILRARPSSIYDDRPPGGVAREDRRAAHRLCRPHL